MNWDTYFKKMCEVVASKSKDTSTQVGAVIAGPDHEVRSTGFNDFPRGVSDVIVPKIVDDKYLQSVTDRRQRPQKYLWSEHAERNAIYNAARCGIALKGCSIYIVCSRPLPICVDCARSIIQSGLIEAVIDIDYDKMAENWKTDFKENYEVANLMFYESGVKVRGFNLK